MLIITNSLHYPIFITIFVVHRLRFIPNRSTDSAPDGGSKHSNRVKVLQKGDFNEYWWLSWASL